MESNTTKEVMCLRRREFSGNSDLSRLLIPLLPGEEVTIGRSYDVTVQLLSDKNPLMLSRKHVIFKEREDGRWTATDNKSVNGVYINGDRIIAGLPWNVCVGDTVQLDMPLTDGEPDYLFDLVLETLTNVEARNILAKHAKDIENRRNVQKSKGVPKKHCIACVTQTSTYPHCPVHCIRAAHSETMDSRRYNSDKACLCRITKKNMQRTNSRDENTQGPPQKRFRPGVSQGEIRLQKLELEREAERGRLQKQLKEESRLAEEKAAEAQRQLKELQHRLQEQEAAKEKLKAEMQEKENEAKSEVEKSHRELLAEREKAEQRLKEALEAEIKAREVEQEERIKLELESWTAKRKCMEEALKEQWEEKLKEKEEKLETAKLEKEKQLESEFKQKEATFLEKLKAEKAALTEEKSKAEKHLQHEFSKKLKEKEKNLTELQKNNSKVLENWMKERETLIQKQLEEERKVLLTKKEEAEKAFKKEIEKKTEELSSKMTVKKMELEEMMVKKEKEYSEMMNELSARRLEQESREAEISKAKEEALHNVQEVMETELQCQICFVLFIEACTLNCSHTFCKYCIDKWRKRKNCCPSCRTTITTETRSIVLDNYIEEALKTIGDEARKKREEFLKEREEESKAVQNQSVIAIDDDSDEEDDEEDDEEQDSDSDDVRDRRRRHYGFSDDEENSEDDDDEDS